MTLPDLPEYFDSDKEPTLVMPFVSVKSKDGPYEDLAFTAGFQCGRIEALLLDRKIAVTSGMFYKPLQIQLDLIAMMHNYSTDILYEDDNWIHVGFTRIEV